MTVTECTAQTVTGAAPDDRDCTAGAEAGTLSPMPDDPPDDAVDPELLAAADREHAFSEVDGRQACLFCALEVRGTGRARRYRARGADDWSPFPTACCGPG